MTCLNKMYSSVSNCSFISKTHNCLSEKVKQATYEVFSCVLPDICFYALRKMNEYPVLSELITGSFYSIAGSYLMYTSYRISKIQKQETSSNAVFRRTCALMGAFCATYGIYTLTSVVAKIFSDIEKSDTPVNHENITYPCIYYDGPYRTGRAPISSSKDSDTKAKRFLEVFLKCPDAKEMYETIIREEGPIRVKFEHPALDDVINKSHGYWNTETREIVLDSTSPERQQFHILIYEIINSSQNKEFLSIFDAAEKGLLDATEYAKNIEKFEYETTKRHCLLTANCIEQRAWSFLPKGMSVEECHRKYSEDFDIRWEKIKHRPHTQIYIDYFNQEYKDHVSPIKKDEL